MGTCFGDNSVPVAECYGIYISKHDFKHGSIFMDKILGDIVGMFCIIRVNCGKSD